MNFRKQLLQEHSKKNALIIAHFILDHPAKMNDFVSIFLNKKPVISQRAAMSISAIDDINPTLLTPFVNKLMDALKERGHHIAVVRVTLRVLRTAEVPSERATELIDYCVEKVSNPKSPIAIKVFSINILTRYCNEYPELKNEVQSIIEDLLTHENSAGIRSCGRKALKTISKL